MEPGYDPLRAQYRMLTTEALIELEREGGLTPAAVAALREELAERDDLPDQGAVAQQGVRVAAQGTPAAVAYTDLASRGARLFARLIDAVIPYAIFFGPTWILATAFEDQETLGTLAGAVSALILLVAIVSSIAYALLADGLPGGQSIGKRLVGICVVDEASRAPCTYWQSFVRNLVLGAAGGLDALFILGQRRQRLGDLAARTIVVNGGNNGISR